MAERAWGWLRVIWANPLLFFGALLVGGVSSFVYSYVPLHASQMWKIGYLEQRVDTQNTLIQDLEERLRRSAAEASDRPERGEFDALRAELEQAQQEVVSQRALAKRSERTIRSLRRSREQWKTKHDELLPRLESAEAEAAERSLLATEDAAGSPAAAQPAELAVSDGPQGAGGAVVLAPTGERESPPSAAAGPDDPDPAPAAPSD